MLYYVDQRGVYTEATYPKPAPRAHPTKPGRSSSTQHCAEVWRMSVTTVSLLTDSDEEEARPLSSRRRHATAAAAAAGPSSSHHVAGDGTVASHTAAKPPAKKRRTGGSRRSGGGGWRRRAGDARPSGSTQPSVSDAVEAASLEASLSAAELRAELLAFGLKPGARAKSALALRLLRARRAAAASEARYGAGRAGGSGGDLPPRFDGERAGHVTAETALEACRLCGASIPPPRRTFCTDECVHFHMLRTSGAHIRKALALRDSRRCALCGVDVGAALDEARRAVRAAMGAVGGGDRETAVAALAASVAGGPFEAHARLTGCCVGGDLKRRRGGRPRVQEGSFWQADHTVAVHDGGGCCGLSNLRTLCTPCHATVTRRQAARRARARRGEDEDEDGGKGGGETEDGVEREEAVEAVEWEEGGQEEEEEEEEEEDGEEEDGEEEEEDALEEEDEDGEEEAAAEEDGQRQELEPADGRSGSGRSWEDCIVVDDSSSEELVD